MRECTFNVLMPGRSYSIAVATVSHNLSSTVAVEGTTGEFKAPPTWTATAGYWLLCLLVVCCCASVPMALSSLTLRTTGVSSLQASWQKPSGDVDFYRLTLLRDRWDT